MKLQQSGQANDISDQLLAFQTQGEGRQFYECFAKSNRIDCPTLDGTWRGGSMAILDFSQSTEWRLKNEAGLKSALQSRFNVNWDLLAVRDAKVTFTDVQDCDFDGPITIKNRCRGPRPITYTFTGLRMFDGATARNVFSAHAVKLYDESMINGVKENMLNFVKNNLELFNCVGSCDFEEDLELTPRFSQDQIFAKASEVLNIPANYLTFGRTTIRHRVCDFDPVFETNRCRMEPLLCDGCLILLPDYPPKMENEINKFITDQKELIQSMNNLYNSPDAVLDDIMIQIQLSIFALGSAQDFVSNVLQYEEIVNKQLEAEEERNKAIVEFIVTFVITEVVVGIATFGIGAIAAGIAGAIANSARWASMGAKLGATAQKLSNWVKSAGQLKSVKFVRELFVEFKNMMRISSEAIKKVGAKITKGIQNTKVCFKCAAPVAFEIGVDMLVSSVLDRRSIKTIGFIRTPQISSEGQLVSLSKRALIPLNRCVIHPTYAPNRATWEGNNYGQHCRGNPKYIDRDGYLNDKPAAFPTGPGLGANTCDHIIELSSFKEYFLIN
jgi:hypothetical protein